MDTDNRNNDFCIVSICVEQLFFCDFIDAAELHFYDGSRVSHPSDVTSNINPTCNKLSFHVKWAKNSNRKCDVKGVIQYV